MLPTHSAGSRSAFLSNTLVCIEETKLPRLTVKALRICARAASRTSRPPDCIPRFTAVWMALRRSADQAENCRASNRPAVVRSIFTVKRSLQPFDGAALALAADRGDHE